MPTYDYSCSDCGHEEEIFESFSSSPEKPCPKCGELKLKRMIGTGGGLIFKGSGFYVTDYRSDSYKSAAKKENGTAEACTGKPSACSGPGCAPAADA